MVKMMVYKLLIGATFTVNLLALLLGDTDQQAGMAIFGVVAAAISTAILFEGFEVQPYENVR